LTEFSWPIRVYYEDTDAGGVVYYANYLRFMERARTEMLRAIGFEQDRLQQEQDVIFAVHSINASYHKPAVFNDELTVISHITDLAKASLTFSQRVQRNHDRQLLCSADIRVACLRASRFAATAIPAEITQRITAEYC